MEGTACEWKYFNVLRQRAWLEGKREMEIAQTLILKPDSVLEYSCFEMRRRELSVRGAFWSNARANMDRASSRLVGGPTDRYLARNFYHTLGGGTHDGTVAGICDAMFLIWDTLKCSNFPKGSLVHLWTLSRNDIRNLPRECAPHEPDRLDKWDLAFEQSFPILVWPANFGGMDSVSEFFPPKMDIFNVEECPIASKPIPTGIIVTSAPPGDYDPETETKPGSFPDKICPAPNCHYLPHRIGQDTGTCQPN